MDVFVQHIINGISLGSIYALVALGYTMVYGILQMINFAHSDVFMVGAFVSYYLAKAFGISDSPGFSTLFILLVGTMIACALLGSIIEKFAYRPLRSAPKINVLITAIGVSLLLQYSGQVLFGAEPKVFPSVIDNHTLLKLGDVEVKSLDVAVLLVTVSMMVLLHYLIFKTKLGMAMRATSSNMKVASLVGVDTNKIVSFTFMLGSALAGVGALLVGMKYPQIDPIMGVMIGMKAFVAAVLGGIGNIPGAVVGALIMGLSEEMVTSYFSSSYRDALAFMLLIVILVFKPSGIFGSQRIEKV